MAFVRSMQHHENAFASIGQGEIINLRSTIHRIIVGVAFALVLWGCGGGGASGPAPTLHTVTLSWAANREKGVNSPGGGYQVFISGHSNPINVPYAGGFATTTTTITSLYTGNYTAIVRAYAALDTTGSISGAGTLSGPSATINIVVP